MNGEMHFHLWLKPAGNLYDRLADLMKDLRQQYGGPAFDPHVTLLGGMEGEEQEFCEKVTSLARILPALDIHLTAPGYQDDYFHCLYFTVEGTPILMAAHQQAQRTLTRPPRSPFHPHVSLLYGVFPPGGKKRIIESLPQDLPLMGVVGELVLVRAGSANPQDWHPVLECRLGKREKRDVV